MLRNRSARTCALALAAVVAASAQTKMFYTLHEGSDLLPLAWWQLLKTKEGKPFAQNLERYGLLPEPGHPQGYIGLSVSDGNLTSGAASYFPKSIGINCAACHVARFSYKGETTGNIDGAPSLFDSSAFIKDVYQANPFPIGLGLNFPLLAPFLALPAEVLSQQAPIPLPIVEEVSARLIHLAKLYMAEKKIPEALAKATAGRLDDFGAARAVIWPDAAVAIDGPSSFLDLWVFTRPAAKGKVHWDHNMNSVLDRNLGQAIVGGALYQSKSIATVRLDNIAELEKLARQMMPPAWPAAVFGAIDGELAEKGKGLYKQHCLGCHSGNLIALEDVKTDPNRAKTYTATIRERVPLSDCDLSFRPSYSGIYLPFEKVAKPNLVAIKDCLFQWSPKEVRDRRKEIDPVQDPEWTLNQKYVSRPHIAIWATAPYLHNNSVPTVWELLKPQDRRKTFRLLKPDKLGYPYDPEKLGLVVEDCDAGEDGCYDTTVSGNRNTGHEWDWLKALTDSDRWALIEYLKTKVE